MNTYAPSPLTHAHCPDGALHVKVTNDNEVPGELYKCPQQVASCCCYFDDRIPDDITMLHPCKKSQNTRLFQIPGETCLRLRREVVRKTKCYYQVTGVNLEA